MLCITLKDLEDYCAHTDIDKEFESIPIADIEINRIFLREIEQATYNDEDSYIDRYGFKLQRIELSTSCKAAMLVAFNPTATYDITPCGYNARDEIIRHCREGRILMHVPGITLSFDTEDPSTRIIDVEVDGHHFTDISRLNYYLFDEWPNPPDFEAVGPWMYD